MAKASIDDLARLRPQLLAFALRRMRNREQAEDAVQEALVAALEGLHGYAGNASQSTWLFGILKHKIVDAYRRTPAEETLDAREEELVHGGPGPEQYCANRNALAALDRGLNGMPRTSAHAFVLREAFGMNTREICEALSVSRANCWVLVHRARARLRDCPDLRFLAAEAG
jgi:RNA polymerase sigma-70 factor (ECF subfamily)